MSEHWSLGYLVGMPIWIVVGVAIGLAFVAAMAFGEDERWTIGGGMFAIGLMWFGIGLALLWPLQTPYHKWIPHSGVVAEVNSRLVPTEKSVEQKIVVRFAGEDQEYGCTDTRCALAKKGDHLDLSCIREWEWAATSGYNCKFVKRVPA